MTNKKENRVTSHCNAVSSRSDAEDKFKKKFYQIPKQITPGLDIGKGCPEIARSENFSYLAVGYLKCGIFVQQTENKPLPFRYLLSYTKM